MKIYCINCNAATEYSDMKPKFCASCGKPFDSPHDMITKKAAKKFPKKKLKMEDDDEEDDEEEEEEESTGSFSVDKLQIEPIQGNLRNVESLADLAVQPPVSPSEKRERPKGKKVSIKQFQKEWQSELTDRTSREIGA